MASGALAAVALLALHDDDWTATSTARAQSYADSPESEQRRIRNRLALIEELLRSRDVSALPEPLRRERKRNLDVLRAYWQRGQFPKNTTRPGERVPFFIDAEGTPCAVGHLIIESGHRDLALAVAKADNNVFADRITDARFFAWAERSGLSLEELYLIQPTYEDVRLEPQPPPARSISSPRQVRLAGGALCFDTMPTMLLRDTWSTCGTTTTFCTTPLACYAPSTGQYLGGSIATCRAAVAERSGLLTCPELQACADDPRQEFIPEADGWKWQRPADLEPIAHAARSTSDSIPHAGPTGGTR
jgi:hypothetical protein